jgi:hypothetical protein
MRTRAIRLDDVERMKTTINDARTMNSSALERE